MATVAQLRKRPHMRHAYLLLIDGVPFAFTDEYELSTASGSTWWTADGRTLLSGLSVPNLTISLDWESGLLEDNAVSFRVLDVDATTLPGFFGGAEKPYKLLGTRLTPGEDPAPAATLDQYGDALQLWDNAEGSYLGTEAIGKDGQRRGRISERRWGVVEQQGAVFRLSASAAVARAFLSGSLEANKLRP